MSATYSFTAASVYLVTLTVNDGCGGVGFVLSLIGQPQTVTLTVNDGCGGVGATDSVGGFTAMVVIYDPNGGFVTGGGWIDSPMVAYKPDPNLIGKANFGFVSKYQQGANQKHSLRGAPNNCGAKRELEII